MKQVLRRSLLMLLALLLSWNLGIGVALAGALSDRVAQFPHWQTLPPLTAAQGDLTYPEWLAGTWTVSTTLVDLVAPLAPELTTPGFESNRVYLNQPIDFQARFISASPVKSDRRFLALPLQRDPGSPAIVADRAFNGLNLARAYLQSEQAESPVLAVKVDPANPNRQITLLRPDRQLVSTVTARATEAPTPDRYMTTELFQQEFRGLPQPYFNRVETTTDYHRQATGTKTGQPAIVADQITAIYLSPQDPNYFQAGDRPVALYRYRLEFRQ
ncbi:DUF6816 family protein [Pantanalinema rosaneae CENA516]|uniref:DUF6816 family protein n=1 Tax=Pantanalinema rosaneae TaxID=1620701 RepID=UPI003D6E0AD7